eukprot:15328434-Alexandrium_andersonii.AAC.1
MLFHPDSARAARDHPVGAHQGCLATQRVLPRPGLGLELIQEEVPSLPGLGGPHLEPAGTAPREKAS